MRSKTNVREESIWSSVVPSRAPSRSNLNDSLEEVALRTHDLASLPALRVHTGKSLPGIEEDVGALAELLASLPAIFIGVTLNVMLCVPFGLAFFPVTWTDFPVPRAIGIQMFLFSTLVCQLVFTATSSFRPAMGMMMVENIPFMRTLAQNAMEIQGTGADALATTMCSFAISTLLAGALFMALGKLQLGEMVHYFPRYVITGCIGGIGVFVTQTGFEVSTGTPFLWSAEGLRTYAAAEVRGLWAVALALVFLLNVLLHFIRRPLLPPFYFLSITPLFYLALWALGVPQEVAREGQWLFAFPPETSPTLMWDVFVLSDVRWDVILRSMPTMIAMTVFSLMHVPINIPSLCASTGHEADMNAELVAHGWSNLLSGGLGGLANYLCYSNSLLYYKCRGGGRLASVILAALTAAFFVVGPGLLAYIPRCMAGCLLVHLGWALFYEGIVDSRSQYDLFEYTSVVLIAVTMTAAGMTAGLAVGVLLAAVTFMVQSIRYMEPVRGSMPGTTMRSLTPGRTVEEKDFLGQAMRGVRIVQLQGNLFFGNTNVLASFCRRLLADDAGGVIHTIVLDFTLVRGVESSAADTIAKIYSITKSHGVAIVYNRGSTEGFPSSAPLSERLQEMSAYPAPEAPADRAQSLLADLHVADDLNLALRWVEDRLLFQHAGESLGAKSAGAGAGVGGAGGEGAGGQGGGGGGGLGEGGQIMEEEAAMAFRQFHALCPKEPTDVAARLFQHFERQELAEGSPIWNQGSPSTCCLLLCEGLLHSVLEEEAGTTETVVPGQLVGEYAFISEEKQTSTLTAVASSTVYVLRREAIPILTREDPYALWVLARIAIDYLGGRCFHPMNRVWETHSLPI